MSAEWLIVLGADGTVLAAQGAPTDWIGRHVADEALPAELRHEAVKMLRDFYRSDGPLQTASVTIPSTGQLVRLLALYAVPVRRAATDLSELLRSTIAVMKQQAEAMEVALTLDVAADIPRAAFVDPDKIAWAVTALVGNALRFVRRGTRLMPGGTISVRARHEADATQVVLEVQDDGPGIPEDKLRHLFRRTYGRLHAAGPGLALVQEVVAAHGGTFDITSRTDPEQSGTTIRLSLPYR